MRKAGATICLEAYRRARLEQIRHTTEHKDVALGAFLDIEGAFDRTSFDTIKQAAERHGIKPTTYRWICAMLDSRKYSV
jgi:hypothetical protein